MMETIKAIIENGVVANVAVVDPDNHADVQGVIPPAGVGIGWLYDGTNFSPPTVQVDHNTQIDMQIRELEGTTERGVREAMLYTLVALAQAQGITEPQLYAANYGYRKARDLDNAIAALRAQRT